MDSKKIPAQAQELSLLFTNDREVRELNRQYRHKNKATDVLSFSQIERDADCGGLLGDVVISLDTAHKQAGDADVSLQEEVLKLLTHGILHLFGYDHENVSKKRAAQMFAMQEWLLKKL